MNLPDVSVQAMLDMFLAARRDLRDAHHESSGMLWSASGIGMCMKMQMLKARGVPPTSEPDKLSLRRFSVGDVIEWWLVRVFEDLGVVIDKQLRLADDELRAIGYVDLVLGGKIQDVPVDPDRSPFQTDLLEVVRDTLHAAYGPELPVIGCEIKSKSSKSFWWSAKQKRSVAGDHQLQQAAMYRLLNERSASPVHIDRWEILSVSKDDMSIQEDGVHAGHVAAVEDRLRMLNADFDRGVWPACECVGTWMERFCQYSTDVEGTCCVVPE